MTDTVETTEVAAPAKVEQVYEIIDNFELPKIVRTRNRDKGAFAVAVDALEVGQGFVFMSDIAMKLQYSRCSPRKFNGKHFTIVQLEQGEPGTQSKFAVRRKS